MTREQWSQIKEIFRGAIDLDPEKRTHFLKERCAGDGEMLRELQSLLESDDEASDFIEQPALASVSEILSTASRDFWNGQSIGQYRVEREIGRGGMGVVLLAVRADDQFNKRVAIKLLQRSLGSEPLLRRFRNERQILALLEHPNIARLLDGGVTDDGLPYFVMEYIEGEPLDKYCKHHALSLAERLKLFRTVCATVEYAHRNLIVHRDLKPSNILVTADGTPKLLDFGIAKLLDQQAEVPSPENTATVLQALTPEYASPEQVRGLHITTASDIYSLGVILYELLADARPYKLKDASPAEMLRVICDTEPTKPSETGNSQTNSEHATPNKNSKVKSTSKSLKALRGDLDNIVMMALRKEPSRRYKSVEQFSEDIRRHLDGLPVRARKDTFTYRATKFIQRNRVAVAAAALIFISLVGGIIATLWQARAARREQAKAEEIKTFLEQTLTFSDPRVAVRSGHQTTITEAVDEAAGRLERGEFASQPEVKAELEHTISESYFGQGRYQQAREHLQQYVLLTRQLYGEHDSKTLIASAYWAALLFARKEMIEAENVYRQVLPAMREEERKGEIKAASLAEALNNFGYLRRTQGDSKEAESLFREALSLSPQMSPEEWRYTNGVTRSTLASTLADQGRFDEALSTSREAVEECRLQGEANTLNLGFALTILGGFLTERGDYAEADTDLSEAEAIFRKQQAPTSLWLGDNLRNRAYSLYQQGKYSAALDHVAETLNIYRESFGTHYDHYPTALMIQGLALTKMGKTKEGEQILRDALKMRRESLPAGHFWTAQAESALGECLTIQKRYEEAETLLTESYNSLKVSQGEQNPRTIEARQRLILLYSAWGKPDLAAHIR